MNFYESIRGSRERCSAKLFFSWSGSYMDLNVKARRALKDDLFVITNATLGACGSSSVGAVKIYRRQNVRCSFYTVVWCMSSDFGKDRQSGV